MSDGKRNRKYSKIKESKRPVILKKSENSLRIEKSSTKQSQDDQIQPKILLKAKEKEVPIQISIATREPTEPSKSQSPNTVSSNQVKDKDSQSQIVVPSEQPIAPVPIMTRPIALMSGNNYQINLNASKLFMKTNVDFFVVGVIGGQGVGKSTIMNILASDDFVRIPYDYYFKEKEGIFPIKFKTGKCSSFPRTESTHMFITEDRMILLDCPPVLCNSYRKDATTNELEDIKMIISLLTVCHLVIVIQDDYFNLNLIRLLQFAELTKPNHDSKSFSNDYFPNILFIKNKAKRNDFLPEEKSRIESMLKHVFKDSQLKVFLGQCDKHKKTKLVDHEKNINYFVFPEIRDNDITPYHPNLEILIMEFRNRVFMSPRNQIYNGNTELTESIWFELVTAVASYQNHFFLTSYEEIRRCHTHSGSDQNNKGSNLNYIDGVD